MKPSTLNPHLLVEGPHPGGVCSDCGRPIADDACDGCHRSKRGGWPVKHVGLDLGKGGPGAVRGSPAARKYQITVKFNAAEAAAVKAAAAENGHAVGRTIRDLVAEALRHRRTGATEPDAERLARRAAFSKPGDGSGILAADRPMRAVMPTVAGGGRFDDR